MHSLLLFILLYVAMLALQAWGAAPSGRYDADHGHDTNRGTDHDLLHNMVQCALDRSRLVGLLHTCVQDAAALRTDLASLQERHQDLQQGHQRLAHQHAELLKGLVSLRQEHESLRVAYHSSEADNHHLVMENGYLLSRLHETSHQVATLVKERDTARPTVTTTLTVHNIVPKTDACLAVAKKGAQEEADRMVELEYIKTRQQKEISDLQEQVEALKEEREQRKLMYENMLKTYEEERRQNEKQANQVNTLLMEQERLLQELDNNRKEQKDERLQPRQQTDHALEDYVVLEEEEFEIEDAMKEAHELEEEVKPDNLPETLDFLTKVQVLEEVEITADGTPVEKEDVLREECKPGEAGIANSLQQQLEYLPEDEEESQCSLTDYDSTDSDSLYYYDIYEHPELEASQKTLKETANGAQEIFTGYDMTKQKRKHLVNYARG